ncbi:MAG: 4Fe-4S dicluster domain-containing protein [Acidobacteria bacterium]|nr:4Fe-4S dicluster domain-containing protein [Acidobacteriota bacterium]
MSPLTDGGPGPLETDRREFLQLLSASLALAGLAGCARQPAEEIVPYVDQPPALTPGESLVYASAMVVGGYARGVLVASREGRPIKVDGNPLHPDTLGASDAPMQASILDLYDPARSRSVLQGGMPTTWRRLGQALRARAQEQRARGGTGLRILSGPLTSPSLLAQLAELQAAFPGSRWHRHDPLDAGNAYRGAELAFGRPLAAHAHLDVADVVVALDADLFGWGPTALRLAREFARRRAAGSGFERPGRLHAAESAPSITGTMADHRLALRARRVPALARALAAAVGVAGAPAAPELSAEERAFVERAARDLARAGGAGLVVAGEPAAPEVHHVAHAINAALGSAGRSVTYTLPVGAPGDDAGSLEELARDMEAGQVEMLIVLQANPAYTAPARLGFAERMARVPHSVHLGTHVDETAAVCEWHVPAAHYLESWSDARASDGTASIVQPLIVPMYGGRTAHELVAAWLGETGRSPRGLVQERWAARFHGIDFEREWRLWLHDGVVPGTAEPVLDPGPPAPLGEAPDSAQAAADKLEVCFRPDPALRDGEFATNAWLLELPRPLTKLSWGNAALLSPETAASLGAASGDLLELELDGRSVRAPALVLAGTPDGVAALTLGHGRRRAGPVGTGVGFDAYALRPPDRPWAADGLTVRRLGETVALACTQEHHRMEGRAPVRAASLAAFRENPRFARAAAEVPAPEESLYPEFPSPEQAWGMAIDLNTCTGCSACVVACQAENNIPVVGREQVLAGREMHWLRIDRYDEAGRTYHQPVPCMHCEKAPCELVCPVGATLHSEDGLNQMVYNRCIGTRYCSNNCPYKVRRFNFLQYADLSSPTAPLQWNPEVTVRMRGVMEKCTYCVQRIAAARIRADREGRPIRDGEVVTACQAACPAEAIVFGDLHDLRGRVAELKRSPLEYPLLGELNTRPRTTYLAKVWNPVPEGA